MNKNLMVISVLGLLIWQFMTGCSKPPRESPKSVEPAPAAEKPVYQVKLEKQVKWLSPAQITTDSLNEFYLKGGIGEITVYRKSHRSPAGLRLNIATSAGMPPKLEFF
ncbi:MAG: hypothetical protein WAN36_13545, partial [Calditrichia bacterium]